VPARGLWHGAEDFAEVSSRGTLVRLVLGREVWHYYTCALATEHGLGLLQQRRESRALVPLR